MMRQASIIASARVRCSGHMHTVSVTEDGVLVLHDHPYLREELAFLALGGEPCRCLRVLLAWRRGDSSEIPRKLYSAFRAACEKACEREEMRVSSADLLTVPLRARIVQRTVSAAQAALASCAYRRARDRWAGGNHHVVVGVGTPANVVGYTQRVWSANGKWRGHDSYIVASVPRTWLNRVHRRGLATVDGVFVLDVLDEDKDTLLVLAGQQGHGFEVYSCRAIVTRAADGAYHIRRWLKEAK